jgi:hypothetical protein
MLKEVKEEALDVIVLFRVQPYLLYSALLDHK